MKVSEVQFAVLFGMQAVTLFSVLLVQRMLQKHHDASADHGVDYSFPHPRCFRMAEGPCAEPCCHDLASADGPAEGEAGR